MKTFLASGQTSKVTPLALQMIFGLNGLKSLGDLKASPLIMPALNDVTILVSQLRGGDKAGATKSIDAIIKLLQRLSISAGGAGGAGSKLAFQFY